MEKILLFKLSVGKKIKKLINPDKKVFSIRAYAAGKRVKGEDKGRRMKIKSEMRDERKKGIKKWDMEVEG